jgi:DNA-binding XRE family transcriptional regulator
MAAIPPAEPLRWALAQAERDGLSGEAALLRALELAILESDPAGEAVLDSVRAALAGPKPGFRVPEPDLVRARTLVAKLEALAPEARLQKIRRSRGTYRGLALAEALVERAWAALPANGPDSGSWATCAIKVVHFSDSTDRRETEHYFSALARAWALAANCSRIACELHRADLLMQQALSIVDHYQIFDLATRAEVMELAARVQRARRKTPEAAENLRWSASVWQALGRTQEHVRVLATLAITLQVAGEPEDALKVCDQGLSLAKELGNQRLQWHLTHYQFELFAELERLDDARRAAEESRRLAENFPDVATQTRMRWLEGRLAQLEKRSDEARRHLQFCLEQFLSERNPYVAALVSLDLTVIHLEAGRYSEAAELARAMAATFDALGVQREAWAACRLFADACERHQASVAVAKNLARYLDQARQDPEYGFPASAMFG